MSEFCSLCHVVEEGPYCAEHGVVHRPFSVGGYDLDHLVGVGSSSFVFAGQARGAGAIVVKIPRAPGHRDRDWHLREAAAVRQRELQLQLELREVGWDEALGVTYVAVDLRTKQPDPAVQQLLALDAPLDAELTDPGAPPVMIASYRVTAVLGAGGTGRVFLGEHPLIGSKVAIKVLRPEIARSPETVERFVQEARASSRIGSPHIPRYFDFGTTADGLPYAIMEYFDGETLGSRLRRDRTMSVADTAAVLEQVASALAMAHQAGLVHRDLKPDNILLVRPDARHSAPHMIRTTSTIDVKVLDFGIAKMVNAPSATRTEAGSFVGTPFYCAPEQVFGRGVDARTDVYSLGATAYEMLSGAPPFVGEVHEILAAKSMGEAPDLGEAGVPDVVAETIAKMLARDPDERAPSMQWVHDEVARWLDPDEVDPAAQSWRERQAAATKPAMPAQRMWPRIAAVIGALAVTAVGALVYTRLRTQPALHATPLLPAEVAPSQPVEQGPGEPVGHAGADAVAPAEHDGSAAIRPARDGSATIPAGRDGSAALPAAPAGHDGSAALPAVPPAGTTVSSGLPPVGGTTQDVVPPTAHKPGAIPPAGTTSPAHAPTKAAKPSGKKPARGKPAKLPETAPDANGVLIVDPFAPSPE